jgi:hypothetical protein
LETIFSSRRNFTYAVVDLPDDTWAPAIVANYNGPQDYTLVLMAFQEEFPPTVKTIKTLLEMYEGEML